MGRQPCCEKIGLKRGPWTVDEDHKLTKFIINNGIHCWRMVPKLAGLMRCGKSCRLRWTNYLRPDLKRGALTGTEENQIIQLHARMGNRWSKIAAHFPGRTDNEIKNHWNTRIKKKLKLMGLDPVTHKPIEHPQRCDQEAKTDQIPSSPSWDETSLGVTSSYSTTCPGKEESVLLPEQAKVLHDGFELGLLHETEDTLLHGYGMLWDSLADEELKPQSKGADPSSSSTSFSMEDTPSYLYMVEQSSALVGNNEAFWGGNLDYVPSWSTLINPLEDVFYSGNNQ